MARVTALLLLTLSLGSCGGSAPGPGASAGGLCLNSACGSPRQIVDLPDLENLLVTPGGRVFVTGQQNFYEILGDGSGSFQAQPLFESGAGCSGLVQSGTLVYVLCQDSGSGATDFSGLMVMDLSVPNDVPEKIYSLTGMSLPNGMVKDGHWLYVTDGPVAAEPKIVRVQLDPTNPKVVLAQDTWLLTAPDYPNGLAITDGSLYTTLYNPTTETGDVARIDIQADGSPGPIARLHTRGIMDDLNVYLDTLLVTDWQGNRLFQITLGGSLLQETDELSFSQPSSVDVAGPPLFDKPTALVTERYSGRGLWVLD